MPSALSASDWNLLLRRIKDGRCTPFLGAGACFGALPLGADLAREWAAETNYPLNDASDLAKVGQFLAVTEDPMSPKEKIREIFKKLKPPDFTQPDEPHGLLADLPFEVYLTTNYDNFMVQALRSRNRDPKLELCRWNRQLQKLEPSIFKSGFDPTPANPVVFHLHGHIDTPESLVLTEDDYLDFLKNISESPKIIPARIQRALTGASLLFLGYSIADLDFRVIFRSLVSYLEKSIHHAHVSVQLMPIGTAVREGQEEDARRYLDRYFGKLEIRMYWGSCCEFAAELRKKWEEFNDGRASAVCRPTSLRM
jgi:hypothetical protein